MNIKDIEKDLEFKPKGSFFGKLNRRNSKIKEDRAIAIAESAERIFKREIEDMLQQKKDLIREREGMLDLSPTHADSLVLANDFDAKEFFKSDLAIGIRLRELEIRMQIAVDRFNALFTEAVPEIMEDEIVEEKVVEVEGGTE